MANCKNCGNIGDIKSKFCPNCGEPLGSSKEEITVTNNKDSVYGSYNPNFNPSGVTPKADTDSTSFGFCVLGFCFPLVGLILFLVFFNEKPGYSRGAGIGALISVIFSAIGYFLIFLLQLWQIPY